MASYPTVGRLLAGPVGGEARLWLDKGGRIELLAFARAGVVARATAPNGRSFSVQLIVDRERRPTDLRCSCAPKAGQACVHVAAAVLCEAPEPDYVMPGERFEASAWGRLAVALCEVEGLVGTVRAGGVDAASGRVMVVASPALSGFDLEPGPMTQDLLARTLSPEELALSRRGVRSTRQAHEGSTWWHLAKRGFALASRPGGTTRVELENDTLWLVAQAGDEVLRMRLIGRAVDRLEGAKPGTLAGWGVPVDPLRHARMALALALTPDGGLALEPSCVVDGPAGSERLAPELVARARCGPFLVLPGEPAVVALVPSGRLFAEPEVGAQQAFDLDQQYRPSPLGLPLDRPTRVPPAAAAAFLLRHAEAIRALPRVLVDEVLVAGAQEPTGARLELVGACEQAFELSLSYSFATGVVDFADILVARRRRDGLLVRGGVLVDPAHPRFGWIDQLLPGQVEGDGAAARLRLGALEVCRLRAFLPVDHELVGTEQPGAVQTGAVQTGASLAQLVQLAALDPDQPAPDPSLLGLELYDFQQAGYRWLWFLWRQGFGGLLCDDMGLGKTHQAIALVAALVATEERLPRVLVVCPASVVPHWEDKLARLLPQVPVHRRDRSRSQLEPGVALASYGALRNDAEQLATTPVDLFILDEVHHVKNRDSATARALAGIAARVRVGLTGTPIENSVEELRALVETVVPGYLPGRAAFERVYAEPIAAGLPGARERLARVVRPFVVRRTKSKVLTGLPEKTFDPRWCDLLPAQRELYDELVRTKVNPLRDDLEAGRSVSTLHVFALLDQLKRLCDHPDLLLDQDQPATGIGSGKWELFAEILDEVLASGLEIVVFSQYLGMLDKMAAHCDRLGVGFASLRGSTVDREAPVARFRDDPDCRVFLASLKAGGVGIDLTRASVVLHYDRWWNRAREDQATDRVHRIGQQRGVQVITLSTRNTVEERIEEIVAHKAELAAGLLPDDEAGLVERFSREDLRRVLG